jgi:hypothetical protein
MKRTAGKQAARQYTDNVYNTLIDSEISGIKLDKRIQGLLYLWI